MEYSTGSGASLVELYDMRARWWWPQGGVFVSVDGFGYASLRTTLWGWPGQNPLRWKDPSGHTPAAVAAIIEGAGEVLGIAAEALAEGAAAVGAGIDGAIAALAEGESIEASAEALAEAQAEANAGGVCSAGPGDAAGGALGSGGPPSTPGVGEYLAGKAPKQVTPGTSTLEGQYVNDLGRVEPWQAHYDEYGRLVGRTDSNAGNVTQGIPDTHYHVYDWSTQGAAGQEIVSHAPGEYEP